VNAAAVILLVFGGISALNTLLVMLMAVLAAAGRAGRMGGGMWQNAPGLQDGARPFDGPAGGMPMVIGPVAMDGSALGFAFLALLIIGAAGVVIAGSQIAAGVWILQRRAWGRILGIVVSSMALIVLVVGLIGTMAWAAAWAGSGLEDMPRQMGGYMTSHAGGHGRTLFGAVIGIGAIVDLALMVAYGWVLAILARHPEAFDEPGRPPTPV